MPSVVNTPAAVVHITLTQAAVPLLEGSGGTVTTADVALIADPAITYVTQTATNAALVFTGAGYINFLFTDHSVRAIGIAFKRNGTNTDVNKRGDINLPMTEIAFIPWSDPNDTNAISGIQVKDTYVDKGAAGSVSWEYYVLFQTSTGTIGAIDPAVENDN